jgi:hypothetical protein
MADSNETAGGHHAGGMGRDGIRSNCLALSTTGAGTIRTWMSGEQRQAPARGFPCGGLGRPTGGAAAVFVAADAWPRIAGAADVAGGEIML